MWAWGACAATRRVSSGGAASRHTWLVGGLRPLHRALLPAQIEPWHLHALKMSLEEAGMERERRRDHGALLLGPLAEGEGPASWLAEIAEVREEIAMKD